jgi:Tripartite ATP-independent periplasmic transporter, DctM component
LQPAVIGALGITALFALILLQVPIGFAMMTVGVVGFASQGGGWIPALSFLAQEPPYVLSSTDLAAVPLFLLMGVFASMAGFSEDIYNAAAAFLGHRRGGLAYARSAMPCRYGGYTNSRRSSQSSRPIPRSSISRLRNSYATTRRPSAASGPRARILKSAECKSAVLRVVGSSPASHTILETHNNRDNLPRSGAVSMSRKLLINTKHFQRLTIGSGSSTRHGRDMRPACDRRGSLVDCG